MLALHLNILRGFRHVSVRVKLQLLLELIISSTVLLYSSLFCASLHKVTKNCKSVELLDMKRDGSVERCTFTATLVVKREGRRSLGKPNIKFFCFVFGATAPSGPGSPHS